MANMDVWDIILLCAFAYVAVTALVRLMRVYRDQEVARLEEQVAAEQRRRRAEKKKADAR